MLNLHIKKIARFLLFSQDYEFHTMWPCDSEGWGGGGLPGDTEDELLGREGAQYKEDGSRLQAFDFQEEKTASPPSVITLCVGAECARVSIYTRVHICVHACVTVGHGRVTDKLHRGLQKNGGLYRSLTQKKEKKGTVNDLNTCRQKTRTNIGSNTGTNTAAALEQALRSSVEQNKGRQFNT